MPESINLLDDEDDVQTINNCVRTIIHQSRARIAMIEQQSQTLIRTERTRVMVETFATICHHLSQPFTAMLAYLHLLKHSDDSDEFGSKVTACEKAATQASDFLKKIQTIDQYETEPKIKAKD